MTQHFSGTTCFFVFRRRAHASQHTSLAMPLLPYQIESSKAFSEVTFDLEPVVQRLGFVVLARQDLGELLRQHGGDYDEDYMIFTVCNYRLLDTLLSHAHAPAAPLPPRIWAWTCNGSTWLACDQLAHQDGPATASRAIDEMNQRLIQIISETR